MVAQSQRIAFAECPLCGSKDHACVREASAAGHPMYQPSLPETMRWCQCRACGHVFTDGYFDAAALSALFTKANPEQEPGHEPDVKRALWSSIVERVCGVLGRMTGRWIDVGFGDGALLCTAQEWGFDVFGVDLRSEVVNKLRALGVPAEARSFESVRGAASFDVISFADVLEHMPFPGTALAHARTLLKQDGALFISMPNIDTVLWKMMDAGGQNPYWSEIEHYHNFSRARLYALLRQHAFEPVWYGVSRRYVSGMEIIAVTRAA